MATEKQKKVTKKLLENVSSKKTKTQGEILRGSGYSDNMSKQPSRIIEGKAIQKELKPIVDKMIEHREKVIEKMAKEVNTAKYGELTTSLDKLTKNIQLLAGKPTENIVHTISQEEQAKIDELL